MTRPAIDKEFQSYMPALTPEEYNLLQAKICSDGRCDPLVLWKGHNILLDGHNRLEICESNEIEYKTREVALNSRAEALVWIFENQCGRRNWTASQRAMLAAKVANLKPGQHAAGIKLASTQAAAKMGVSPATLKQARAVIADGSPTLQQAVKDGKVPVSTASQITDLPTAEQTRLTKQGKKAVAEAAKKADTPKPPIVTDQLGQTIPTDNPEIIKAFQRRQEIQDQITAVGRIKSFVLGANNKKDALWWPLNVSDFEVACERLRGNLTGITPYAVCCYCSGAGCKACHGHGWLPRWLWDAAPADMKPKKK